MREKQLYQFALDQSAIVAVTDVKGTITYANDLFCKISGYTRQQLVGSNHRILNSGLHSPEFFKEMYATIASGKVWHGEIRNKTIDGNLYWVDTTIVPFLDEQGKVYQYVSIRYDITQRKAAEDALRKLNAELEDRVATRTRELKELNEVLEAKVIERTQQLQEVNKDLETFNYSVSHDLQSPLRILQGFCDLLKEECTHKMDENAARYIEVIYQSAARMNQLIADLLNFAHIGKTTMNVRMVDMNALVQVVVDEVKSDFKEVHPNITINNLNTVFADAALLRQVWTNLINNAVKYSSQRHSPTIEIGNTNQNGEEVYYVRDNGTGFDMRYSSKLFRVFQRLHQGNEFKGTGIGLAIVHRIITKHGGKVWAQSEVDKGSTFYFTLPHFTQAGYLGLGVGQSPAYR